MSDTRPIVFAKFDHRAGKESICLIFRPDRSTFKGETQLVIPVVDLDNAAPSDLRRFLDAAEPIIEAAYQSERGRPPEFIKPEFDDELPPLSERLKRWSNEGPGGWGMPPTE